MRLTGIPLVIASCVIVACVSSSVHAENESGLYGMRLVSVEIPLTKQKEVTKAFGAELSRPYIYVCILVDGNLVWRSKKVKILENEATFTWNASNPSSLAGVFWDGKSELVIKAFISDNDTVGAASATDKAIFEKVFPAQDSFPLAQPVTVTENILGDVISSRITFKTEFFSQPLKAGELEPGRLYLVAVKTVYISEQAAAKGEKDADACRYYLKIINGKSEIRVPKGTFSTPPNQQFKCRFFVVPLTNRGFPTQVLIHEEDPVFDDTIFSAVMAGLQGKDWLFTRKAVSDDPSDDSYVEFQTYGPIK
jgi:hypothetical protein